MKKRKKRARIIVTGALAGLVLFFLAGNIYFLQYVEKETKQKNALEEEKEKLEFQVKELQIQQKEVEKQLKQVAEQEQNTEEHKEDEKQQEKNVVKEGQDIEGLDGIQEIISNQTVSRIEKGEHWAVYVQDLESGIEKCSGQSKMQAASLIKLYIMGAVYENYEKLTTAVGKGKIDALLHSMITVSDNEAANTLTKLLGNQDAKAGREVVNTYCSSQEYKDSSMGRMLLESNENGDNYTSVKDCGLFLERVYKNSIPHADEMLNLLKQQERTGKIPAGVPSGVETANKTGELSNVENDAAIVFAGEHPYILCVMSENINDAAGAREVIINLSSGIYERIK